MKKRALLSVSDKTGICELASSLAALGYEILSTGGTCAALAKAGIPVTEVSAVTGFPECLDGRVKTLHPMIHAGILAMRSNPQHMAQLKELGVAPIDVVVINLYPFKQTIAKPNVTFEEAIENIDIGGPSMLRGAAKNWQDVCVVTDPADYAELLEALRSGVTREQKLCWCKKVFQHTAAYDAMIAGYLCQQAGDFTPDKLTLTFDKAQSLRYGENPHQTAAFYKDTATTGATIADAVQLHGKELSFNNINDTSAALALLREFDGIPAAIGVKHANPCGVGIGESIFDAYLKAYNADPVSIFGGIVALNMPVDEQTALELAKTFLEVIIAPAYEEAALKILNKKKNVRLLVLPDMMKPLGNKYDLKKVSGGLLLQSPDVSDDVQITVVTERAPTDAELNAMLFGWRVVKHTRSNAIVLSTDSETTGIGPGQTNRITALELAINYAGDKAKGSVMASDAFFPFRDCVDAAAKAGVTAIIQPGGSVRDQESLDACNEHGIAMVFTGKRHFRH